jgi:ABC-2 type transport system permease protein
MLDVPAAAREARAGLGLYRRLAAAQVHAQLQYRASFALQVAGAFALTFVDFLAILLLFHRFPALAGWSLGEIAFLYGVGGISFALADMVIGGFDRLSLSIQTGEFDRVLTRPVGSFLQTLAADIQLRRLGRTAQAAAALGLALTLVEIDWSPLKLLVLAGAILSGIVIFASIFVIGAALTFWTVQTSEVTNVFTYGGSELVSYPLPIYADWLRRFFTFIVPLGFITYLPALYILGKPDPLGLPGALRFLSLPVAGLFFLAARAAWAAGVRHYQGTGS